MSFSSPKSITVVLLTTYVFQGLSILLTIIRLWYRWYIQRLWWEDAWAAIALFFAIIYLVANVLIPYDNSHVVLGISSWLSVYTFTFVVWAVRMSMVLSIVRVMSPTKNRRLIAIIMITLVTVLAAGVIIIKIYLQTTCLCGCPLGYGIWTTKCHELEILVIFQFCGDCVADAMLLAVPLRLLRDMNIPSRRRRMISYLFSSSILITIASLFNASVQLVHAHYLFSFATSFEVFVSLIVCNVLVIVTFVYRAYRKQLGRGSSDDSTDWSSTEDDSSPVPLTTVELDIPTTSASCMTEEVVMTRSEMVMTGSEMVTTGSESN